MCGFLTVYSANPKHQAKKEQVQAGLDAIYHRGPDENNIWISNDQRMVMGHTRLSIIGLGNGLQPISDQSGALHLVVNGEFYDFERIRDELRAKGYHFSTESDSEIALYLYKEYGTKGLERLRGEFAMVLYDAQQNCVIAMRDRMGIKPLFYGEYDGKIYFASEAKAIINAGVPAVWDEVAYVTRSFYLDNSSLFKYVNAVTPGHMMLLTPSGMKQHCYWDIEYNDAGVEDPFVAGKDEKTLIRDVHDAIAESVRLRLRADVPVGIYLSGGVDSSAMLGMATELSGKSMDAFNLSFVEMEDYDENRFARLAAERAGAKFHTIPVTQDDLADNYEKALWHNETPFFNAHGVAKFMLSGIVRDNGIKAVLTGEGADEVFAGYPHFKRDMVLFNSQNQDPEVIANMREKILASQAGYTQSNMPKDVSWLTEQIGHGISWLDNQAGWFTALQEMYSDDVASRYGSIEPYRMFFNTLDHRKLQNIDPVHRSMYLWAKSYLPAFVLTTLGDRMEMGHSVEGRVPLLDHHVVEMAAKLPVHMKIRNSTEKYIFREAMKNYLPVELYERKKHYFRAPPATLLRNGRLFQLVRDTLNSQALEKLPFYNAAKVRKLIDELPDMSRERQALLDPMIMELTSMCMLQNQYNMTVDSDMMAQEVAA